MGRNISQFAGGQVSSLVINNTQPLTDNQDLRWSCTLFRFEVYESVTMVYFVQMNNFLKIILYWDL